MTAAAIIILLGLLGVFGALGAVAWLGSRKRLREAKNYERGLKMVPMLIHLPPQSSDVEAGSRDARDVSQEAISQAQILYDILASTAKKGFKSNFYGQRHISLELIAYKGRVDFYTAVPIALVSVVQQAIVSAYPSARLEEVEEHNIFSPAGKMSGTIGGELTLKDDYILPISTFEESKRDSMTALLNSLSDLTDEDGAGIQILLRPTKEGWAERGLKVAREKREGKKETKGLVSNFGDLSELLWKPPEVKENETRQLTNLEIGEIDAIENKTKHAAYETLVRVVASSNTIQRSQGILNNMIATFSLFDAPGKNGFKYTEAKDIESFVTAYIMRFFPPEVSNNILNSVELATVFHFPDDSATPTSQLQRQASKQVDGPRNMPSDGMLLGYNVFRSVKKEIRLSDNDRRRHMYIVGQTGTGKSTILENLALQDMLDGKGFAFVDPHGDTVEKLMAMVPKERVDDIIYFNPSDMDHPMGLNLFEFDSPDQKDFLIQEAINMLYKLYDPQRQGIIGPRYEHWFRNASLTLMSDPAGSTFIDIPKVFTDDDYAKQKLKYVKDRTVLDFWNKEMAGTSDYHKSEVLGWFVSKFGAFLSNEMMRNIIGQTQSSFNLREVMDEGKILLVNLSKGKTGELNSKLLGMIFVMKFQSAAMSRANIPESERRDFSLYVDEFQNFSTDSFADILSEARKYRLTLIVANQYISQLSDDIRDAVFGNVGSVVSFRTGPADADFLVKQFTPTFDADDLTKVPNYNAVAKIMVNGVPSQPFSIAMLPPLGHENEKLADALKRMSALKFGKPKALVEQAIFKRLETIAPAKSKVPAPRPNNLPAPGSAPAKPASKPAAAAGKTSFLDDWLAKRKQRMAASGKAPAKVNPALAKRADDVFKPPEPDDNKGLPFKSGPPSNLTQAAPPPTIRPAVDPTATTQQPPPSQAQTPGLQPAAPVDPSVDQTKEPIPAPSWVQQSPQSPAAANNAPAHLPSGDSVNLTPDNPMNAIPASDDQVAADLTGLQPSGLPSDVAPDEPHATVTVQPENDMAHGPEDDLLIDNDGNLHYREEIANRE